MIARDDTPGGLLSGRINALGLGPGGLIGGLFGGGAAGGPGGGLTGPDGVKTGSGPQVDPGAAKAGRFSLAQVVRMALNAGFTGDDAAHIAAIAMAENGGNPNARGGAGEYGLTQINPHAWPNAASAADPQTAFNYAYKIYRQRGGRFGDWSTDPSSANFTPGNSYQRFMEAARRALAEAARARPRSRSSPRSSRRPWSRAGRRVGAAREIRAAGFRRAEAAARACYAERNACRSQRRRARRRLVDRHVKDPDRQPERDQSDDHVTAPDPHSAAAMVGLHLDRAGNNIANVLQGAFQ